MVYIALLDNMIFYLGNDAQMEEYLSIGACIYRETAGVKELIATPDKGFIVERPVFPRTGGRTE